MTKLKSAVDYLQEIQDDGVRLLSAQVQFILINKIKDIQQNAIEASPEIICEKVTRIEVIDNNGRAYVNWDKNNKVELQLQDDGKTIKIFISNPSHH